MRDSIDRGYKLALGTLIAELALLPGLLSDALGIFAIFAMPLLGIAWLPASLWILADLRQHPRLHLPGYLLAVACGLVGIACVGIWLRWIVLAAVLS